MNNTVQNPKGIDKPIQRLQNHLYSTLGWTVNMYGRVYKTQTENGLIPQPYKGNGEYLKDAFFVDKGNNDANIFFIDADRHVTKDNINFTSEVKIVFMVNLKELYPTSTNRADEDCHEHVYNIIRQRSSFKFLRLEKTIKTVFRDFSQDTIQKLDTQPYHTFAMVGTINYNFINC